MKQCAVCSRTYADNTLEFCLDDGARLFLAQESEATKVRPDQPAWQPLPPPPDWSQQPTPVQPVPAKKSRAWVGLLIALFAAGLLIASALALLAYMNQSSDSPQEVAETKPTPAPTAKAKATPEATPETTPTPRATPKPAATPATKPTPEAKPTPDGEATPKPTAKTGGGCFISNDNPNQPNVNLRSNCHVKSCDDDTSTIIGTVSNGTPVTVNRQVAPVRGRNFAWQQVTLSGGRIGWVAASKVRCQ
jgi:cell wall-associated NlpC family hydrolase